MAALRFQTTAANPEFPYGPDAPTVLRSPPAEMHCQEWSALEWELETEAHVISEMG